MTIFRMQKLFHPPRPVRACVQTDLESAVDIIAFRTACYTLLGPVGNFRRQGASASSVDCFKSLTSYRIIETAAVLPDAFTQKDAVSYSKKSDDQIRTHCAMRHALIVYLRGLAVLASRPGTQRFA